MWWTVEVREAVDKLWTILELAGVTPPSSCRLRFGILRVVNMADWVNAGVGAALGAPAASVFDFLIEQVKFVMHCKEECLSLAAYLRSIKPMLEEVSKQCQANPTVKEWLRGFEECVEEGSNIIAKCKSGERWDWLEEVKYGKRILEVKGRIETHLKVAALAHMGVGNPSSSTSKLVQEVPRRILGMDHHFKVVHASVLEGVACESSSCVSIRGMGGAGKTLLAQMVNNDKEIEGKFGKDSIFWITVGRDALISSIYEVMRKYLHVTYNGESLTDQRTILKEAFSKRRVLMILDDVWDDVYVQHESMIKWLNMACGRGSVMVVTTRMESVTRAMKAREEVILLLSEEDSWRLFCIHAFGSEIPKLDVEMETLAKDACKECKCLPLALKVIGCAMNGESEVWAWKSTLKRMQVSGKVKEKSVEEELFKRFQISYDQLDEPLKICFLYFAAFPEDYEVSIEMLCQVWIAEGLFDQKNGDEEEVLYEAKHALHELRKRCLIESCRRSGGVKMHDILRDLAVQLTSEGEESTRESLFTFNKRNYEVFDSSWLGSQPLKVKRMSLRGYKGMDGKLNAPYLRVCLLYFDNMGLRRHRIDIDRRCAFLHANFYDDIRDLRYLLLRGYYSLETLPGSIGGLGSLQHLDLGWCHALKELPESIGGLGSLQHLNLEGCEALKELPESIGGLGSLQHLNLEWCKALEELPESIGGLGSLQHFNLRWCKALKELPESIGGLRSLQHLDLERCVALKELPESIGGLGSLQHLNLEWCDALEGLPESIGGLGSLQHLNLECCDALEELPESIGGLGSLQYLNLGWCKALKELPESIGGLGSLQHLDLERCVALKELPESIGGLGSLEHLNLEWCDALEELPESIGGLGSLQHLNLEWCDALEELPESIGGLGSLQHLNLEWCKALEELPESIEGLGSLQHLNLECCDALKELPESIGGLGSLQHLNLEFCRELKELPESMGGLPRLQQLNLKASGVINIPTFSKLFQLKILY